MSNETEILTVMKPRRKRAASVASLTVEQQYSADDVAKLVGVDVATIWRAVALYETSGGRQGLGPKRILGHRTTRFAASAVNGWLKSREV